jgi:hypothetical protein
MSNVQTDSERTDGHPHTASRMSAAVNRALQYAIPIAMTIFPHDTTSGRLKMFTYQFVKTNVRGIADEARSAVSGQ